MVSGVTTDRLCLGNSRLRYTQCPAKTENTLLFIITLKYLMNCLNIRQMLNLVDQFATLLPILEFKTFKLTKLLRFKNVRSQGQVARLNCIIRQIITANIESIFYY